MSSVVRRTMIRFRKVLHQKDFCYGLSDKQFWELFANRELEFFLGVRVCIGSGLNEQLPVFYLLESVVVPETKP